jgi:hypothetical protein
MDMYSLVRLENKKERLESMECSLVRWASTKGTLVKLVR